MAAHCVARSCPDPKASPGTFSCRLQNNHFGNDGAEALAAALPSCPLLTDFGYRLPRTLGGAARNQPAQPFSTCRVDSPRRSRLSQELVQPKFLQHVALLLADNRRRAHGRNVLAGLCVVVYCLC